MKKHCFISAMFRSGSTMLARMLNTHSKVASASDPIRPLFNSFRYDIAEEKYRSRHNRFDPLDDYFLQDCDLFTRILDGGFNIKTSISPDELTEQIRSRAKNFSGDWADSLEEYSFDTYDEFIRYFLKKVDDVYGVGKKNSHIAFKEVWSTEFYPALKKTIPKTKCIILVRDPRAVVSSKNATGAAYPYFFMGRQWRKLAYLAALMKYLYEDDVYILRYEDLVTFPEKYVRQLCDFLEIKFEEALLDVTKYKDGSGNKWLQNTSYDNSVPQYINAKSLEKWKAELNVTDIRSVELICYDWMKFFNYKCVNELDILLSMEHEEFKVFDTSDLADWIQPFVFEKNKDWLSNQIIIEKMRLSQLDSIFSKDERVSLQVKWW
jgi:hypothetical protein